MLNTVQPFHNLAVKLSTAVRQKLAILSLTFRYKTAVESLNHGALGVPESRIEHPIILRSAAPNWHKYWLV